jgi:hypothetical protein
VAILGMLEGCVGLTLDLVDEVGEVLGGKRGCEGRSEVLVGDVEVSEVSEVFVALADSDGGEFLLGGGDDLMGGLALHVGVEPQGGGRYV